MPSIEPGLHVVQADDPICEKLPVGQASQVGLLPVLNVSTSQLRRAKQVEKGVVLTPLETVIVLIIRKSALTLSHLTSAT